MGRLSEDIKSYKMRDPACRSALEVVLLYPGFTALWRHRIAHFYYSHKLFFLARCVSQMTRFWTGIEIHPGAKIGRGFFIDHGAGVVIGETAEIGDNCTLYQGVTLGGTGKDTGKRHPTLGDDVLVGTGSKILGPVKIGSHSKIAAGSVVLCDIPEYSTAVGTPARVVKTLVMGANDQLDHVHIPDPVSQQLLELQRRIEQLEARLKDDN